MTVSQRPPVSVLDLRAALDRDRLVERLGKLVRTPSENPPGNEQAVAALVAEWCRELDLAVAMHEPEPGRPSVVARWDAGADRTVGYCSHIDVVPVGDPALWAYEPFGAQVHDGRMHGRGTSDAKGPVAAALEAVAILRSTGFTPRATLELELVADEEAMGFKGAGYLTAQGLVRPDVAIVGEPTSLRVVRAQRGAYWFRIFTRGVAGHGSAPERGKSAIKHMAEIVLRLDETLPDATHPILGGPSLNVGTIRGGAKVNIVPAGCVIEVDRRTVPGETHESVQRSIQDAIDQARERFPDLDAEVELAFAAEPFEVGEEAEVVRATMAGAQEASEIPPGVIGFRGASDARFLAEAGADVVVFGPGQIELAHTATESIDLDELARGAVAYAGAFARLLQAD